MADHIARAQTEIDASPDTVWALLTQRGPDPDIMFGAEIISDWTPGSPIRWKGEWDGKEFEDKGQVVEVDPPTRLAVTHFSPISGEDDKPENYHRLSYDIERAGDGTRVTLEQHGNRTPEAAAHSTANWQKMLDGVKKAAERS